MTRAKSFPVPSGRTPIWHCFCTTIKERIHVVKCVCVCCVCAAQSSLFWCNQTTRRREGKKRGTALTSIWSLSISERTQPIDPSPLQIRIRNGSKCRNNLNLSVTHTNKHEWGRIERKKEKRQEGERKTNRKCKRKCKKRNLFSPKTGSSVHQIKHLSWIEELFETSQKLDALVIARFRIDKDQQWRTALRSNSFPSFIRAWMIR